MIADIASTCAAVGLRSQYRDLAESVLTVHARENPQHLWQILH
jgi:hypothetical protein